MKPSEIRAELLGQHAELRRLMDETRTAARAASDDDRARGQLAEHVTRLGSALRAHNEREETLLKDILRTVDAWGQARTEIMNESHVDEHMGLLAALLGTNAASDGAAAARGVNSVLDRVAEHMAKEEEIILSEGVLRDDNVVIEYFGG